MWDWKYVDTGYMRLDAWVSQARPPGKVSEESWNSSSFSCRGQDVVRYVVGEVLEGLQDMHGCGWMHRDVKASGSRLETYTPAFQLAL